MDSEELSHSEVVGKAYQKSLLASCGLLLLAVVCCLAAAFNWHYYEVIRGWSFLIAVIIFLIQATICVVMSALFARFINDQRPGLEISSSGISFWRYHAIFVTIPWREIERIELSQDLATRIVYRGRDSDSLSSVKLYFRPGLGPRNRMTFLERRLGIGDACINHRFLDQSPKEIFATMSKYFEASRTLNDPAAEV